MTRLALTNAHLIDPATGLDAPGGVLIQNGMIADAGERLFNDGLPEGAEVVDCQGKILAPGLVDFNVSIGEPGARHKESFRSGGAAAAKGGVTTIVTQPNTDPPLDEPAILEFVLRRAQAASAVRVLPTATLTKAAKGKEMTEYRFLLDAGAVALTDGENAIADPVVFRRCLEYAASVDALVCHHPQEPHFSALGCATEGLFASMRGLPEVPAEAEAIMLTRDIRIAALTGARYHAAQISTAESLGIIRRAKEAGANVTCSVAAPHFSLNEFDIADFRTFLKVCPPLRTEEDRSAMEEALADGLIDVISSAHRPQDEESKRLPFAQAAAGGVGLETLLAVSLDQHHRAGMSLTKLFDRLALAPARLAGLNAGHLGKGALADLVLFDPHAPWVVDRKDLISKSKNSPFHERRVQGKVLGTWVEGKRVFG